MKPLQAGESISRVKMCSYRLKVAPVVHPLHGISGPLHGGEPDHMDPSHTSIGDSNGDPTPLQLFTLTRQTPVVG